MWNERDIWLQHDERMARLQHAAYVTRICQQRRARGRLPGVLVALLGWVRTHTAPTAPDAGRTNDTRFCPTKIDDY